MGNFLSSPITEKETQTGKGNGLEFGVSAMQGWRTNMEDSHIAVMDSAHFPDGISIFAVCDGHGGKLAADFAAENMLDAFSEAMQMNKIFLSDNPPAPEAIGSCLRDGYLILDGNIRAVPEVQYGSYQSGCTAISAFITHTHIIVANSGMYIVFFRNFKIKIY
jgi:protein phosphatase 1B